MATFACNGIEMDGTRDGDGPPLLALHGGGGPGSLTACCGALAGSFDVLAPTHPGFGQSPLADGIDSVDDLAYLYMDLMDTLDLRDVTLMGFSMGGWLAAEIAVRSTARLARVILVDAVGIKTGDREERTMVDVFGVRPAKIVELAFHDPKFAVNPTDLSDEEFLVLNRNREALARYTWSPYMHNPKLRQRLHRIDVPTMVLWGESDGLVPVAYGKAYCEAIGSAEMVVIPKAGHQPQVEQLDEFVGHVTRFAAAAAAA